MSADWADKKARNMWDFEGVSALEIAAALRSAHKAGMVQGMREAAEMAQPPLMHRKGNIGLWRKRRAEISASINARADELEKQP